MKVIRRPRGYNAAPPGWLDLDGPIPTRARYTETELGEFLSWLNAVAPDVDPFHTLAAPPGTTTRDLVEGRVH